MTFIRFLGLDLDSERQLILIPECKQKAIHAKIKHILANKMVTVKCLQSLTGSLNFYAKAKPGGRTLIRWVYNAYKHMPKYHHVNVTGELRKDLHTWKWLLSHTELGTPFLEVSQVMNHDLDLYTDAARGMT